MGTGEQLKNIRILISGGGTGGHIYPALAIADELRRRHPDAAIHFVGANGKMEMEKVPQNGYTITGIDIAGINRAQIWKNISLPFKLMHSYWKTKSIIRKYKPQAVVGVGGYASGPLVFLATRNKIPGLIQEQNSYPGITNKMLSKYAKKICVAYPNMETFFPAEKIVLTGNPVRNFSATQSTDKKEAAAYFNLSVNKKTILILGGSLGARTINEAVMNNLENFDADSYQILWQCGKIYYETLNKNFNGNNQKKHIVLTAFIDRMDYAYTIADVVVSRAGAISISELAIAGKAVILVPSPNVAEDHQTKNARVIAEANAAVLIKDTDIKNDLGNATIELLNNETKRSELQQNISAFSRPDAAEKIVTELLQLIHKN